MKLSCNQLDFYGKGIIRHQKLKTHHKDALIGEAFLCKVGQDITVLKRLSDAKERSKPFCPYYHKCGGCHIQHMSNEYQSTYKTNIVQQYLNQNNLKTTLNPIIQSKHTQNYRVKLITTYKPTKKGILYGLYEEESHTLIPIKNCPIQDSLGNAILETINDLLVKHKIKAYDEDKREGVIRHTLVRVGLRSKEVLVCFVIGSKVFPGFSNLLNDLKKTPQITSVYINTNQRDSSAVLSSDFKHVYGKKYIKDTLMGLTFFIGPDTFYQINPPQAENLYKKAISYLELNKKDILLDCYSGIGTITLSAASHVKEAIGVEYNKKAVQLAILNAKTNAINNTRFYAMDATHYIKNYPNFNKLIVDPPRSGLDEAFIDAVLTIKPERMVYVSCNPETLVRDLKRLEKGYLVKEITPVDMFVQTYHVETITLLSLRNA